MTTIPWEVRRCDRCRSTRLRLEQIPLDGQRLVLSLWCQRCFWKLNEERDVAEESLLVSAPATARL